MLSLATAQLGFRRRGCSRRPQPEGEFAGFWDDRCTARHAVPGFGDELRRLPRVTGAGDKQVGPTCVTPDAITAPR